VDPTVAREHQVPGFLAKTRPCADRGAMHQGDGEFDHNHVADSESVPACRDLPIKEPAQQRIHSSAPCCPAGKPQGHEAGREDADE
jgi:hypothetical protein